MPEIDGYRKEVKGKEEMGTGLLLKFITIRIQFELKEEYSLNKYMLITYYAERYADKIKFQISWKLPKILAVILFLEGL